jgi:hypothetical protein
MQELASFHASLDLRLDLHLLTSLLSWISCVSSIERAVYAKAWTANRSAKASSAEPASEVRDSIVDREVPGREP